MIPTPDKSESPARVFIHCFNRLLRESIARILIKRTAFEVVTAQGVAPTEIERIGGSSGDVLVLDSLELISGALGPFQHSGPAPYFNCVLVAMEDDYSQFLAAIRRGARGYVLRDASAGDVVAAIRTVSEGQAICPPHYTRFLFDHIMREPEVVPSSRTAPQWELTRREQQLIPLIGRGLSNKEIASHFNLCEQTVKNHIHRMMRKAGVSDRISIHDAWRKEHLPARSNDVRYSD